MNNHIGVAFSSESISFAHFIRTDAESSLLLDRVGLIKYPFQYEPHLLYREENIKNLGNLLRQNLVDLSSSIPSLSVSVESNLATLKQISYPIDFDEKEIDLQISWEIRESMPQSLEHYVYMRTNNLIEEQETKKQLVIVIPKKIIIFISHLVDYLNISLNNLSLHPLAVEVAVQKNLNSHKIDLLGMVRIAKNHIETIVLKRGNFLYSFYDIFLKSDKLEYESSILERIKARIHSIENLFQQYKFEHNTLEKLYLYGNPVEDSLLAKIKKNISIEVDRFNPIENITKSENFKDPDSKEIPYSNLVECIGVALDI